MPVTRTSNPLVGPLTLGAAAGVFGSWAKALTEPAMQRIAERIHPPPPGTHDLVGADPSDSLANMPPAVIVRAVTARLGRPVSEEQSLRAQSVIHYLFGAGYGVGYAAATAARPGTGVGRGLAASALLYAGTHGSGLALVGVQLPPTRLPAATVAWELASHLFFGLATDAALRTLRRVGAPARRRL